MLTFQFRLLSDEVDDFLMDVEVPSKMNLLEFCNFLQNELGYDPNLIASIFCSDVEWEKLNEFTSVDMGIGADDLQYELCEECDIPKPMAGVGLDEVVVEKFDRLLFVFDQIGERQLYIELLRSLKPEEGVVYPRVIDRQGTPPPQICQ